MTEQSKRMQIEQVEEKLRALNSKEQDLAKQVGEAEAKKQIESERTDLQLQQKTAEIELKQSDLQKQSLENQVSNLNVKSEMDGTVISVNQEAASKKSDIQEPVIHIGDPEHLVVAGNLSEYDTLKVKKAKALQSPQTPSPAKRGKGEWRLSASFRIKSQALLRGKARNKPSSIRFRLS